MNLLGLLVFILTLAGITAETISLPKSRSQLKIPKGDWLTMALGVLPAAGVLATNLDTYLRPPQKPSWLLVAIGAFLCIGCIVIRAWSKLTLRHYYTFAIDLRKNHRVIEKGPYRFIRHPLYLGTLLGLLGLPLMANSWLSLLALTIPTGIAYGLRLFLEERFLLMELGANYQEYAQRTRRLIPFLW